MKVKYGPCPNPTGNPRCKGKAAEGHKCMSCAAIARHQGKGGGTTCRRTGSRVASYQGLPEQGDLPRLEDLRNMNINFGEGPSEALVRGIRDDDE